ncbi:hypothetical protein SDC9_197988 [bioreactor metagenome]|uniref:Uncharacterized protein n=1 Tax=bioreactor metagenome TaxID=1076179 RepID=A0A645IHP8_9ZZZZ
MNDSHGMHERDSCTSGAMRQESADPFNPPRRTPCRPAITLSPPPYLAPLRWPVTATRHTATRAGERGRHEQQTALPTPRDRPVAARDPRAVARPGHCQRLRPLCLRAAAALHARCVRLELFHRRLAEHRQRHRLHPRRAHRLSRCRADR